MSENSRPLSLPPFASAYRASGLLLHVTSLPSPYGRAEGNWRWRCTEDMLYDSNLEWLRDLTKNSNRLGTLLSPHTRKVLEAVSRI